MFKKVLLAVSILLASTATQAEEPRDMYGFTAHEAFTLVSEASAIGAMMRCGFTIKSTTERWNKTGEAAFMRVQHMLKSHSSGQELGQHLLSVMKSTNDSGFWLIYTKNPDSLSPVEIGNDEKNCDDPADILEKSMEDGLLSTEPFLLGQGV